MSLCVATINLLTAMASASAAQKGTAFGRLCGLWFSPLLVAPAWLTQPRCPALTQPGAGPPPSEPPGLAEKARKGRATRGAVGVGGPGSAIVLTREVRPRRCSFMALPRTTESSGLGGQDQSFHFQHLSRALMLLSMRLCPRSANSEVGSLSQSVGL